MRAGRDRINFRDDTSDDEYDGPLWQTEIDWDYSRSRAREPELPFKSVRQFRGKVYKADSCVLCQDRQPEILIKPCNHVLFCQLCRLRREYNRIRTCPNCRVDISEFQELRPAYQGTRKRTNAQRKAAGGHGKGVSENYGKGYAQGGHEQEIECKGKSKGKGKGKQYVNGKGKGKQNAKGKGAGNGKGKRA